MLFSLLKKMLKNFGLLCCVIYLFLTEMKNNQIIAKESYCFQATFLKTEWTDNRPGFVVNMTFSSYGTISSQTNVNVEVQNPVAHLAVIQTDSNDKATTLYNVTSKLCELKNFFQKLPAINAILQTSIKGGNYTFDCPLKVGVYTMENMRIPSRNPILNMIFRPKTRYTFIGEMYDELPNKSIIQLTTYKFSAKIIKKLCKN